MINHIKYGADTTHCLSNVAKVMEMGFYNRSHTYGLCLRRVFTNNAKYGSANIQLFSCFTLVTLNGKLGRKLYVMAKIGGGWAFSRRGQ